MDQHLHFVQQKRIERTIANLERNNMHGYFVPNAAAALETVKGLLKEGDTVAVGSSMTLFEVGVIDLLRQGNYHFIDRHRPGLTKEQLREDSLKTFSADVFFTSSNAITEEGELYNVDGKGTRVAPMLYGPEKVIVVAGVNKIVRDLPEAIERNKEWAAPTNARRLNRKTPCVEMGVCIDCKSPERICNEYTLIRRQIDGERIHVILVDEALGY